MLKPVVIVALTFSFTLVTGCGGGSSKKSSKNDGGSSNSEGPVEHGLVKGDEVVVLKDSTLTQEGGSTTTVTKGTKLTISNVDGDKIWTSVSAPTLLIGHKGRATAVMFSSDGNMVVSGGGTVDGFGEAILWETQTGKKLDDLTVENGLKYIADIAFDPQDKHIAASSSFIRKVIVWDAKNKKVTQMLAVSNYPNRIAFSPDGSLLAVAETGYHQDRSKRVFAPCDVSVWKLATGEKIFALKGNRRDVHSVSFSSDGKMIASGGKDGSINVWDLSNGQSIKSWTTGSSVGELAFLSGDKSIASTGDAGNVQIWEVRSGRLEKTLSYLHGKGFSIACSDNGEFIACGDNNGVVRLWNVTSGKLKLEVEAHKEPIQGLSFSKEGTKLISGSWDSGVRIFNVGSGEGLTGWVTADNLLKVVD